MKSSKYKTSSLLIHLFFLQLYFCPSFGTTTLVTSHGQATINVAVPPKPRNSTSILTITTLATTSAPGTLVFSVFYKDHLNSWTLEPLKRPQISQELCAEPESDLRSSIKNLTVRVFSTSSSIHSVDVSASWSSAVLEEEGEIILTLVPGSAQTLYHLPSSVYNKDPGDSYLISLTTISNPENCLFLAISPSTCPWPNSPSTVRHGQLWARVLATGYFQIRASEFPKSFIISLIPLENSRECHSRGWVDSQKDGEKMVKLSLKRVNTSYWKPVVISVMSIIISSILILLLWRLGWNMQKDNNEKRILHRKRSVFGMMAEWQGVVDTQLEPLKEIKAELSKASETPQKPENILRRQLALDLEEAGKEKNELQVHRILQDTLYLKDVSQAIKDSWHRRQRSKVYLYLVPLLAIFYLIPSVQMVFTVQDMAEVTGSLEQCYLNFGCSRPLGELQDFNHIISNSGYIIYGLVFIVLVRLKSMYLPAENRTDTDHQGVIGLPQQHSLFYTMGVCMVMQGIFSSVFHVCPSNISLQFDTTMMYVMLILVFVKVYQFRHPDLSSNAYPAMYVFSVALALEACSLYIFSTGAKVVFYLMFCLFYFGLLVYITVDCYFYGAEKSSLRIGIPIIIRNSFRSGSSCLYPIRFFFSVFFVVLNLGLMVIFLIRCLEEGAQSLSTPILVICAVNVGVFLCYYMIQKLRETIRSKEGEADCGLRWALRFSSYIFLIVALILAVVAISFYARRHQSRNSTPAESRDRNELCNVMDFFDNHDMWHFLSSIALFLTFIFLLTIDDDILMMDRDKIRVF